jgi:hypothetical protein
VNPLALIPLRVWLIIAAAAALGFLLWHDHHGWTLARARKAENAVLSGKLEQAETNARLTREASNDYQQQLEDLRTARTDTPTRAVRLCRSPDHVPATAGGPRAEGDEGLPEAPRRDPEVSRDIGPELYSLADDADQCAAQRDALIAWALKISGGATP